MSDDDHSPASENDQPAVASGFSAFGEEDRKAEQRAKRKNLTTKVVAGALVLVAVGAVAALTGNKPTKSALPPPAAAAPVAGTLVKPVPPQVVFLNDQLGYALYLYCDQPVGQGCEPALWRTDNGAKSWDQVTLPADVPVDPTAFLSLQVNANYVLLAWTSNFTAVLPNDATLSDAKAAWKRVTGVPGGTVSTIAPGDFFIGGGSPMRVVDPGDGKAAATAVEFRPPQKVEVPGVAGGTLSDGKVWLRDPANLGVSTDHGVSWNVAPAPDADMQADPLAGGGQFLALLTGPTNDATTGPLGDGDLLPARNAYFSTNSDVSWDSPTALTGATVNAVCTVYLDTDHSLLGVATDGKSLRTLPAGKSVFGAPNPLPPVIPTCLQSHDQLIWGAASTTDAKTKKKTPVLLMSTDSAKHWLLRTLPAKGPYAVAAPSPTPSAVK